MYFEQHNFTGKNLDEKKRSKIDQEYISISEVFKDVCTELLEKTDNCIGVIMRPINPVKVSVLAVSNVSKETVPLFDILTQEYSIVTLDGNYRRFKDQDELKKRVYEMLQSERIRFMLEDWQVLNIKMKEEAEKLEKNTGEQVTE